MFESVPELARRPQPVATAPSTDLILKVDTIEMHFLTESV
jgi:hypothetical protein